MVLLPVRRNGDGSPRPTSLLIWIPVFIALFFQRRRLKPRLLIGFGIALLITAGLYLVYNMEVFGNFLATGYSIRHIDSADRTASGAARGFFEIVQFHPRIWLTHIVSAPISFSLAFPPLILGVIGYFLMWKERIGRRWLYFAAWLGLVLLGFFSNFATYGYFSRELVLRSSFFRYCLPALIFLVLPAAFLLTRLNEFFQTALAIVVAFNIAVAFFSPLGLVESEILGDYYRQARKFILKNTDENTVILSAYWDKLVFPERLVYSDVRDKEEESIRPLLSRIRERGYEPVYIAHYDDYAGFEPFFSSRPAGRISGPDPLRGILKWLKPPSRVYPVEIHELVGDGRGAAGPRP